MALRAQRFENGRRSRRKLRCCTHDLCQLPAEAGPPSYMGARLKKPAYDINDAPHKRRGLLDSARVPYGLQPPRASRSGDVMYDDCRFQHRTRDAISQPRIIDGTHTAGSILRSDGSTHAPNTVLHWGQLETTHTNSNARVCVRLCHRTKC